MIKIITHFSLFLYLTVFCSLVGQTQEKVRDETQFGNMALINSISFHDAQFDNKNAGNGFVITYAGKDYAITAKHVLMIAKTDQMEFVDLEGHLKQWTMYQKNSPSKYLATKKLLNSNKTEKLEWESLSDDWLVFSIEDNKTGFTPLKFRETAINEEESLYVIGWAYQDKEGPQRVYEFSFVASEDNSHTLEQITGPKSLAGLSGSPIVDKEGLLIGLVASGWEDEKTQKVFLQASKASDIQHFLDAR